MLIKAVIQAIPSYAMSMVRLPNPFVTLFALWWPAFGGNLKERRGVFIGGSEQLSPPAKKMEGWGLENLNI